MFGFMIMFVFSIPAIISLIAKAAAQKNARRAEEAERRRAEAEQEEKARKRRAAEAEKQRAQEARAAAALRKRQEKEAKQAAAHAQKLARARELAELAERRLNAEKELQALRNASAAPAVEPMEAQEAPAPVEQKPAQPTPDDHLERGTSPAEDPQEAPGIALDQFMNMVQPKPFKGQIVAFTGRLTISGMTRTKAIEKVIQAGGQAYRNLYASSTLLVVGTNPGMTKMDQADKWIGSVHKITEREFISMLGPYAA